MAYQSLQYANTYRRLRLTSCVAVLCSWILIQYSRVIGPSTAPKYGTPACNHAAGMGWGASSLCARGMECQTGSSKLHVTVTCWLTKPGLVNLLLCGHGKTVLKLHVLPIALAKKVFFLFCIFFHHSQRKLSSCFIIIVIVVVIICLSIFSNKLMNYLPRTSDQFPVPALFLHHL